MVLNNIVFHASMWTFLYYIRQFKALLYLYTIIETDLLTPTRKK